MTFPPLRRSAAFLAALLLAGCDAAVPPQPPTTGDTPAATASVPVKNGYRELLWDDLMPQDWDFNAIYDGLTIDDLADLEDFDPRANEVLDRLKANLAMAPVVEELDGQRVRLPGYAIPIDTNGREARTLLLVPYMGACIHVPPPPANQTVHVVTANGAEYQGKLFDTVWVTGTLKVESSSSELAEAGYRIDARRVEPYE